MVTQHSAAQDLAEAQPQTSQTDDFAALLTREFRPRSERAGEEVRLAVRTLAEQVLERSDIISDDLAQTINAYVAEIDRKISEQLNLILHAPQFQALEGAWRGLHYLVSNTESDTQLKIRVLNVSKRELAKNLKRFKGTAWDQSPVFKKIYEAEYGQLGGEPYGCLIGDYHFDHSPQDVDTLRGISQIAAASHAPFIAAAGPGLMGMESWSELSNPRDLAKIFPPPITRLGVRCVRARMPSTWRLPCRARWRGCRTEPRPIRWKRSTSKKTPRAPIRRATPGKTPPTRWRSTSTAPSSSTVGAPAFAAWSQVGRWKACRRIPSRPTMAVWT